jgi:hypothetical protein
VRDFYASGEKIFRAKPDDVEWVGGLWEFQAAKGTGMQEIFTSWLMEQRCRRFIGQQDNNNYKTWLASMRDDFAGKWLEALPKQDNFVFSNKEFQAATCYRLLQNS